MSPGLAAAGTAVRPWHFDPLGDPGWSPPRPPTNCRPRLRRCRLALSCGVAALVHLLPNFHTGPLGDEYETGGGFGGRALGGGQDGGVGVGGQAHVGMPELVLDSFHVRAGGVGEGRRPVPQVVQPDRRQPGPVDQQPQALGEVTRVDR